MPAEEEFTVLPGAPTRNWSSTRVITESLSRRSKNSPSPSPHGPEKGELFLVAVKHAGPLHMDIPCISRIDHCGCGGPVPAGEDIGKGMSFRKRRPPRLMTYETSHLPAVGQTPVRKSECPIPVHARNIIESLLPSQRKFSEIAAPRPRQPREAVENRLPMPLESRCRPCNASSEFGVLPASFARDFSTVRVMAVYLTGPQTIPLDSLIIFIHDSCGTKPPLTLSLSPPYCSSPPACSALGRIPDRVALTLLKRREMIVLNRHAVRGGNRQ